MPPTAPPDAGVYALPLEAFQFRDLDSGRTFYMDKRFWIKDVDSGKVYVLEPDGAEAGSGGGGDGGGRPGAVSPGGGVRVSDLLSGQAMSLEEFEETLGFFKVRRAGACGGVALRIPQASCATRVQFCFTCITGFCVHC